MGDVVFLSVVILLLMICCAYFCFHRFVGMSSLSFDRRSNEKIIRTALKKLNCEGVWQTSNKGVYCLFDYQNDHFSVYIDKNSPFVQLGYYSFFEAPICKLNTLRYLVNSISLSLHDMKMVYNINESKDAIYVHLISSTVLPTKGAERILQMLMQDMFRCHSEFLKKYSSLEKTMTEKEISPDMEKQKAEWKHELFLIREQELLHQGLDKKVRHCVDIPMTFGKLFGVLSNVPLPIFPVELQVVLDDKVEHLTDSDSINQYDLSRNLINRNQFIREKCIFYLTYSLQEVRKEKRNAVIVLNADGETDQVLYYKATLTSIQASAWPAADSPGDVFVNSCLIGYDLMSSKQLHDKFLYVWKETMAKIHDGKESELTSDEKIIAGCLNAKYAKFLYRGKVLYDEKRYYEAIPFLMEAFEDLQNSYDQLNIEDRALLYEVCYMLGFAYCELKLYRQAYYFLEITLPLHQITYTEEYVNCLVNSNDFRAISVLEELIALVSNREGSATDMEKETFENFHNFLQRRRVFTFIEKKLYEDAEKILKKMLEQPDNCDFAITELAYLQKIKK